MDYESEDLMMDEELIDEDDNLMELEDFDEYGEMDIDEGVVKSKDEKCKELIEKGQEKGFLTYSEIIDAFDNVDIEPDEIEDFLENRIFQSIRK